MKKMMILAMMMAMTITANAMSYTAAKNEALFLSDKMAYELNLTDAQYDAVYEINLDYLMSVNGHADVFGIWWDRRNADLRFVLTPWQYEKYVALNYFYRPVSWHKGALTIHVYSHYDRGRFFKHHPTVFVTYKGGNNHKADRFYADRHMNKPSVHHNAPMAHHDKPAVHNNNVNRHKTMVSSVRPNVSNGRSHNTTNRAIAQNSHSNRSGSGHFSDRR